MKSDNIMLFGSEDGKEAEQDQEPEKCSTCIQAVMEQDSVTAQSTVQKEDVGEMMNEETGDKEEEEENPESDDWAVFKANGVEFHINLKERLEKGRQGNGTEQDVEKDNDDDVERYIIGKSSQNIYFAIFKSLLIHWSAEGASGVVL